MTALKLYISPGSAPSRAVLFMWNQLAYRLSVRHKCEVYALDLSSGDHKTHDFLKLNPTHTVPTLDVGGHGIWESRALLAYLCDLAGGHEAMPWDPALRAELNRLLNWDLGTFYPAVGSVVYPQIFGDDDPGDLTEALGKLRDALVFLEQYQLGDGRDFLLGDTWTIADVSIAFGLTMTELVDEPTLADCPRITAWRERMAELPGWAEVNAPFEAWKATLQGNGDGGAEASEGEEEDATVDEAPAPSTDA